jgi:hypothetical protein
LVASTLHVGPIAVIADATAAIEAWSAAHGRAIGSPTLTSSRWVFYLLLVA